MAEPSTIAHYRITTKLGEGGMGEVYRATDTKLSRDVAIKVLPESFSTDPERLARFTREAQVLASLNHPNIAAIYGVEDRALILELVEGPTLAERIAAGPMPPDEALAIARQIADALEYAHERGVVHRDLKPANVKITPEGRVKVLDFGLAKAMARDTAADAAAAGTLSFPTITIHGTLAGTILGTAAYMSPEQARGHNVDKRTDIWAFGAVLYEMLTGRILFEGPTVTDTLAHVLTRVPDLTAVPPRFQNLLARCLERDPRSRLRDIGDAAILLDAPATVPSPAPPHRSLLPFAVAALVSTVAAAALAFVHFREQPPTPISARFEIHIPDGVMVRGFAISPDGRRIVFQAFAPNDSGKLWTQGLDDLEATTIPGTENAGPNLVWTDEGRSLVFESLGKIRKLNLAGGSPVVIGAADRPLGLAANRDGIILVSNRDGSLTSIRESGGQPTVLLPPHSGVRGHVFFLADGKHFLYGRFRTGDDLNGEHGIYVGALDDPRPTTEDQFKTAPLSHVGGSTFHYVSLPGGRWGYLVYPKDGTLTVQKIDERARTVSGSPQSLSFEANSFSASMAGVAAYRSGGAQRSQLTWFDRSGRKTGTLGDPGGWGEVALSPDGKIVEASRTGNGGTRVWIGDVERGVFSRLTTNERAEVAGAVSRDGKVAITVPQENNSGDLYVSPADGAGPPELWVSSPDIKHPNSFTPDGKFLVYDDHAAAQRQDLWIVPVAPPHKPIPFLTTAADETFGQVSPDGKWMAYTSDETTHYEIYVRGFAPDRNPAVGPGRWVVSVAGGNKPRWSRDGRELFYLAPDGKMMAVPIKPGTTFIPGVPAPLFDAPNTGYLPYDVAPDGRFLINTPVQDSTPPRLVVLLNWTAMLR